MPEPSHDLETGGEASVRRFREWCDTRRLRPGERIGSERQLADELGMTRTQLRPVLDVLEEEGYVQRRLGRSGGVFRDNGRIQRHLNTIQGVPEMVRQQGLPMTTVVLGAELGLALADEARNLQIPDDAAVCRVTRLRLVDGASWSLDHSTLPARMFPRLWERDLTGSLYEVLRTEFSVEPDRAEESLEVTSANSDQATTLGVPVGTPLLEIWRVTYNDADVPIEFAHDFFRADRTRVHLQKYGTNWKRALRGPHRADARRAAD